MGDVALRYESGTVDLAIDDDDIVADEGLRTAVLLSLFTDRRAEADDALPAADGNLRGWWADEFSAVAGDRIGSRLWLLDRSTRRADLARRAEELVRDALAWMIEDRVTDRIDVGVVTGESELVLAITLYRPSADPVSYRFVHAWDAEGM